MKPPIERFWTVFNYGLGAQGLYLSTPDQATGEDRWSEEKDWQEFRRMGFREAIDWIVDEAQGSLPHYPVHLCHIETFADKPATIYRRALATSLVSEQWEQSATSPHLTLANAHLLIKSTTYSQCAHALAVIARPDSTWPLLCLEDPGLPPAIWECLGCHAQPSPMWPWEEP